jgi:diguanylate cyclase
VVLIDIDHFKKINDIYGHVTGDQALLQVVSRLKKKIRRSDKIGRYGGDEIIVILPNCGQPQIERVGDRLRLAVGKRSIKTDLDTVLVTVSAGCATSELPGTGVADKLIRAADRALLKAKRQGRNCVVVAGQDHMPEQERKNARFS